MRAHHLVLALQLVTQAVHLAAQEPSLPPNPPVAAAQVSLPPSKRTIRLRVSEGTWMSLDVSPDGRTIIFDLLGDIFTIPISGGAARPLSSGPAFDSQPHYSPDGRHVAFISDHSGVSNLWIMDRSGHHARQVSALVRDFDSPISSPCWAPDGRSIFVSQRFGADHAVILAEKHPEHRYRWLLARYDVASRRMRWLSDTAASRARRALGPACGPDSTTLFAAVEAAPPTPTGETGWGIERVDVGTGTTAPETSPTLGRAGMRPVVSPNGQLLAYVSVSGSRRGLRLRDLRTFRERWLAYERLDAPSTWGDGGGDDTRDLAAGYAFTPDSKALVIAFEGRIHRIDLTTGEAHLIPFVADVEYTLPPLEIHQFSIPDSGVRARGIMQAALSPNGSKVCFSALNHLWVMDLPHNGLPASSPKRLTKDNVGEFYPSWSPSGDWIVYSTWRDGEGGAIYRAWIGDSRDGHVQQAQRLVADTALFFNTAVTPDGKWVFAVRALMPPERLLSHRVENPVGGLTLISVPSTGGAPTIVGPIAPERAVGVWAGLEASPSRYPIEQLQIPDTTTRIHIGLTSLDRDGSNRRTDVVVADREIAIRSLNDVTGMLSPDGTRAIITHNWTLYEVSLASKQRAGPDTLDLMAMQARPFGHPDGASRRWGRALAPWISWSQDGRRVLFVQGGTLFIGDVPSNGWTDFTRVDVPLVVPRDKPEGTFALRGAQIVTMRGSEIIPNGTLVIHSNRIAAVGPSASTPIPSGVRVFDVPGTTILPGYVDIHDHLQISYGVHPGNCWACLMRLASGVTTIRDPYAPQMLYNDVFAYRDRERSGDLLSPRIFTTGIVHLRSDHPIQSLEDALDIVKPTAEYFDAETFKEYSNVPWPAKRLIVAAAAKVGLNATIHGEQVRAVFDGFPGVEHAIRMPLYDDVLSLIARSGSTFTHTFGTIVGADGYALTTGEEPWALPRLRRFAPPSARATATAHWVFEVGLFGHPEWDQLQPLLKAAADVAARGGKVGIGMHGNIPGLGIHYEMWFHSLGGMPTHEILRSATIVGATAIGHARDLGSLEPGKLADLQVLDASPLVDIRNSLTIRYVVKNGRVYCADDLTELWPQQRPISTAHRWDDSSSASRQGAQACSISRSDHHKPKLN